MTVFDLAKDAVPLR